MGLGSRLGLPNAIDDIHDLLALRLVDDHHVGLLFEHALAVELVDLQLQLMAGVGNKVGGVACPRRRDWVRVTWQRRPAVDWVRMA